MSAGLLRELGGRDETRQKHLRTIRIFGAVALLVLVGSFALAISAFRDQPANVQPAARRVTSWQSIGEGSTRAISGLALVEQSADRTILLAVHDSKAAGEPRLTLLTRRADEPIVSIALAWPDAQPPIDLEAIARVPGRVGEFILLTSSGDGCVIVLEADHDAITVRARFKVPNAAPQWQFEGFDLQSVGSRLIACWGERGDGENAAQLFWGDFNVKTLAFGAIESAAWRAPWPLEHQRDLSDLRLRADGTLLISASSDPGNDGPFAGAVYVAGTMHEIDGSLTFTPEAEPACLFATSEHKLEGIALLSGTPASLILGADDENRGGALMFSDINQ